VADLLTFQADSEKCGFDLLTPREREVLQLIAEGHTNRAIAQMMQVSVKTVEKHRASLMSKLDVYNVAGLARIAIKHGLVFLNE
jgi:DNA-binding NarL/FixJ family response regulator